MRIHDLQGARYTTLTTKTRAVAADTLESNALSIPDSLLGKSKIKNMFIQALSSNSSFEPLLTGKILNIFSALLPYILQNKETAEWFHKNLYGRLQKIPSDEKVGKNLREKSINILSRTARLTNDQSLINRSVDTIVDLCLNNQDVKTNPARDELVNFEEQFRSLILEKLVQNTQKEDKKAKAEETIQYPIQIWWSKNLSKNPQS